MTALAPGARAELGRRHREKQAAIADNVGTRLSSMLAGLTELDQAAVEAFGGAAFPVVRGGQEQAAWLAAGYTRLVVGNVRPVDGLRAELDARGVAVTPESRSLVAPVLRGMALVAEGVELADALGQAGSYAAGLASNDLQAAQRVGLEVGVGREKVRGWEKDLDPSACEWCLMTADKVYGSPESVPFHDNDKCGVAPVL